MVLVPLTISFGSTCKLDISMSCPLKTKVKDPESEKTQQKWVELVHTDGTIDLVDTRAVGGNVNDLPKGYFWSAQFVGTVLVRT